MSDERNRVARAIYDRSWMYDRTKPWTIAPEHEKRLCYAMADAALAEMGAAKVKPLTEEERASVIQEAYEGYCKHQRGIKGQIVTEWDGIESWIVQATERRILAALE